MSQRVALLDAYVLYPAPLRDLFLELAVAGLFQAKWSADIHQEWIVALLRNEPWRSRAALDRTRDLMDQAVRDCLVTDYASLIPTLDLPDIGDRHVLAAAIVGRCEVIVTQNLAHFPAGVLTPLGIEAEHPDAFLSTHLTLGPDDFCDAVRNVRARLVNPPYSVAEYLGILSRQGLVATISGLQPYASLL